MIIGIRIAIHRYKWMAAPFGVVVAGVSPVGSRGAADTAASTVRALPSSIFICDQTCKTSPQFRSLLQQFLLMVPPAQRRSFPRRCACALVRNAFHEKERAPDMGNRFRP